jgi:hypothetical protein
MSPLGITILACVIATFAVLGLASWFLGYEPQHALPHGLSEIEERIWLPSTPQREDTVFEAPPSSRREDTVFEIPPSSRLSVNYWSEREHEFNSWLLDQWTERNLFRLAMGLERIPA